MNEINFIYNGDPNGGYRQADEPGDGIYNTEVADKPLPVWEMRNKGQDKLLQLDTTLQMIDDPNLQIYKVIDKYMDEKVKGR